MPILEAMQVSSGYGETEILHGVSMLLEPGEFVTIIGPNGAGKSTLVKTIIGLLKPTRGRILFEGRDITGMNPEFLVTLGLVYIPQTSNTFPTLTVLENLEMGAITRKPTLWGDVVDAISGALGDLFGRNGDNDRGAAGPPRYSPAEFQGRVEHICQIFPNLSPKLNAKVQTLSGGEQQMVAIARSLVLDPKVLLVDEPSAGLAPKLVALIFDKIQEINEHGVGIVLVEQNARKALGMADRGYVLEAGKNRFEGPGQALLANPDVGRLYLGG